MESGFSPIKRAETLENVNLKELLGKSRDNAQDNFWGRIACHESDPVVGNNSILISVNQNRQLPVRNEL
jgi:hypothetical protein